MINEQISEKILTVCPDFRKPKGGVAQCVATYAKEVFGNFKTVSNSCSGTKMKKTTKCLRAIFSLVFTLVVDRSIRIVHIHTASYNSFKRSSIFVRLSKLFGKKVLLHIHGGGFKEYYAANSAFVQKVFSRCDALAVLSPSWKEFFDGIASPEKVKVVPNIIEYPLRAEMEKDGKMHILFLGQISHAKGIFDLVELLDEYQSEYTGKLVLDVGGGACEEKQLRQYVEERKLSGVIHLHGWVSGCEKVKLLNLADAFILPSYVEGVPISILEAEAYGLPILSTPVGGISEIVSDGDNGFLFSPGNKDAMKSAIDRLLRNADLCIQFGMKSEMMVTKNLPSNVADTLAGIYAGMLSA